jgi:hypothetical protein
MGLSLFFFVFAIGIIFGKAFGHLGVSMQCLDRAQHAENVEIRFFFGLAACSSSPLRAAPCTCSFAGVLVSVLARLTLSYFYSLIFVYVMLTFSHTCYDSSSSLQHLTYSHISIRYISLLSPSQHHPFRINHFRIHFVDSEFEKTIISKFKI